MAAIKPFDLFDIPLTGTRLIEASAGTGKTYTIVGLFLRLLLEKAMTVEKILVVTYTKAATEELKSRIRARIVQARSSFAAGHSTDDFIGRLLAKTQDHRRAYRLLGDALTDFDRAAIFTIHGFCQRLLHESAFETGSLYETELIADPRLLQREIAEDFWRIHFYDAPPEWISYAAHSGIRNPYFFEQMAGGVHFLEPNVIPEVPQPELNVLKPYRTVYRQLATQWPQAKEEVTTLLQSPDLDGRIYGSVRRAYRSDARSNRQVRIDGLAAQLDRFTGSPMASFPPFKDLVKFATSGLQKAARRGQQPPRHSLFDTCDELLRCGRKLETEMQQLLLHLKTEYFRWAAQQSDRRKQAANIHSYNDLLLTVKRALASVPDGEDSALVQKARKKYGAALVDEFQDSDTVQVEIFSALFGNPSDLLLIIGDPKQSIYSFRGADVFSYLKAASRADSRYTLQANWRSEPGLIRAVNALFADTRAPFLFDTIACEQLRPGDRTNQAVEDMERPMVLWFLTSGKSRPLNKSEATAIVSEAVGNEIHQLVQGDGDPVPPADIAVLVRTNRQAQIVKESLTKRNIPAVLYSSGSVFHTHDAQDLLRVLTGILETGSESRFRSAMATDLIGISGDDLARSDEQPLQWETRRQRFREYATLWKRYDFIRMFRTLLSREKARQRLLALSDGERRLTNVLHLAELLHREADYRRLSPAGLLKWLVERCSVEAAEDDEHQLRLESDELAVKIVTVHKSKGLEYPIVFCPFGWDGSQLRTDGQVVCHSPDYPDQLTVDLGSEKLSEHRIMAQHELLAENLRLLYVAVTRAKKRCYLAWGRIRNADTSALAYLLHLSDTAGQPDVLHAMKQRFAALDDDDLMADLRRLARRSEGCISIENLPQTHEVKPRSAAAQQTTIDCPVFSGQIDTGWKISSFSAMVSRQPEDAGWPDHDIDLRMTVPGDGAAADVSPSARPEDQRSIFDFPRGARAGIFFHDLLEHLDFSSNSTQGRSALIRSKLGQYGYEAGWQITLGQMVDNLLRVPLPAMISESGDFTLSQIEPRHRINEMEFTFPQKPITPEELGSIFNRHPDSKFPARMSRYLQSLRFSPTGGFLMGYIDMLFTLNGRFYLLDWKSNHLGYQPEDYSTSKLAETMVSEHYVLQYCLYTVAANRYLQMHRADYSYAEQFGGIFYLFIRGVQATRDSATGIYCHRPHPDLIRSLDDALIAK